MTKQMEDVVTVVEAIVSRSSTQLKEELAFALATYEHRYGMPPTASPSLLELWRALERATEQDEHTGARGTILGLPVK